METPISHMYGLCQTLTLAWSPAAGRFSKFGTMIRQRAAITAASIAGVVLAGGTAVGANIGILNAADDSEMGALSAEVPITAAASVTSTTASDATTDSQWYTADEAGDVEVMIDGDTVELGAVLTNQGWSWESRPSSDGSVVVYLSSDDDELVFTAELTADGRVAAGVERIFSDATAGDDTASDESTDDDQLAAGPNATAAPAPASPERPQSAAVPTSPTTLEASPTTAAAPAATAAPTTESSAYHDDDEYEDHDEYEDDDDDDEYEGADDDD